MQAHPSLSDGVFVLKGSVSKDGDTTDHWSHFIIPYFPGVKMWQKWSAVTAALQVSIIPVIADLQLHCAQWLVR